MPPLYAYYIYFFSTFSLEGQNYILTILFSQVLLSSISVAIFYKISKIFFSKTISLSISLLYSLFPLHVYACSQISSISLQTFLTILFVYFFFQFIEKRGSLLVFAVSFVGGLIILLRQEFVAVLVLSLFYAFIFYKIRLKEIFLILLISLVTISPYLIRNIIVFETITITKTTGYNFWKGSHPNAEGLEGSEIINDNLKKQIDKIPKDKFYGLNFDNLFLNEAIKNIKVDPTRYLTLFIKKAFSFLFIDINSPNPNYYNPLHYIPVLLFGIIALIGIGLSDKKSHKLNYLVLLFFFYVFIFSTVSILPRYKLIILPLQIIFAGVVIESFKKFISRHK
jgi:4-amino-4-deoxy-L-arabinose transferase-like glycosyltransferase